MSGKSTVKQLTEPINPYTKKKKKNTACSAEIF